MADDPKSQLRRTVLKLKIQLKNWEKSFENVNGRKPNRDDIKRAGSDVKSMYKRFWFYKANPGQEFNRETIREENGTKKASVPKQSTSGIAFFEDSVVAEKTKARGDQDDGDSIMKNLMMSFKSNKRSFTKNGNTSRAKKIPLLEVVPESPGKEGTPEDISTMGEANTFENDPIENTDANAISRSEFIRKMFHGEEDDLAYKKEIYEDKKEDKEVKLDEMFEGCTLLPVDWKPKAAPKRKVTSKKKSAENFIRLDMKHKSYASKGYKKFNVQKYKRKQHRKLRRDKCFCCGESGHWANACPMKLSNGKSEAVDEDGIPILSEDQIVMDEDSDDLVVKVPSVVYSNPVKATTSETTKAAVPEMSRSEKLFMSILNEGKEVIPKAPSNIITNNFVGSSFGSSGESVQEASNESQDSFQYNLFDEDDMMEEFLGKEQLDNILATI